MTDTPSISPFLPNSHIQFAWDSTSLGYFKSCPRKYYYTMVRGLRKYQEDSVALVFGLHYHRALETFHRLRATGIDYEPALRAVVRQTLIESTNLPSDDTKRNRFTLLRTIVWYLEEFRNDAATTLILSNGKPAVELSFRLEISSDIILCGHMDRVARFHDDNYVVDTKTTTTTLSSSYFDRYNPDNQMSLYIFASGVIYSAPVKGVIIDAAQVAVGFSTFSRAFTYRTPDQTEEWLRETKWWISQAQNLAASDASASADHWPMNDKSCHDFGGCPFRPICSRSPSVRESFLSSDYIIKPWNPLEVR